MQRKKFSTLLRDLIRFRAVRVGLLAIAHTAVFVAVYWLAMLLRFDFHPPEHMVQLFFRSMPWFVAVKLPIFYLLGHYHGWWRYVAFSDIASLLKAVVISFTGLALLDHFALDYQVPRTVLVLDAILTVVILGALRCSFRLVSEHYQLYFIDRRPTAILICRDQETGLLANQLNSHSSLPYRIVSIIDPTSKQSGSRLGHLRVFGGLSSVISVARKTDSTEILLANGELSGADLRELVDECEQNKLNLHVLPQLGDMFSGGHRIPVREVQISDLLRREPVKLDTASVSHYLRDKIVLVTGAGGSIGSEICRQVLKFGPKQLILVGRGENRIFQLDRELSNVAIDTELKTVIADVTSENRMRDVYQALSPEVVFHAAAHKHVALMERNVSEAIRNNILGTQTVADLAREFGVERFVLVSTDKAVNPTSVMGATKHMAERYIHALSGTCDTRFLAVRFGNVLGSNGSVVPIFQEQIRKGGPITITDERMRRYFMSIPEASQLVLQAGAMGEGGEIFVLDMGEPVRIVDLARDLIRLSGLDESSIEIKFVGARPGEKMYEELYFDEESTLATDHPKLRAAYHRPFGLDEVSADIDSLSVCLSDSNDSLRMALKNLIPEFTPTMDDPSLDKAQTSTPSA